MLVIVDYGVGNLTSIKNMLKKAGHREAVLSSDPDIIGQATKLILPGVGHFDYGMQQLNNSGLRQALEIQVLERKTPILGICLGAQLLTSRSDEGEEPGLGWVDAETVGFNRQEMPSNLRVPHMGWAEVNPRENHPLFEGLKDESRFYFVHSFHMVVKADENCFVKAEHGYTFCAGIHHGHILGVQFHPEKSHRYGMKLLQNFVEYF